MSSKLSQWKENGSTFSFNGDEIFYISTEKSDEVLLCVHGFPSSSFDYHKIWDQLGSRFPLLSYDLIGYGFSAKPANRAYTTFEQADVLQALLKHVGVKRVHLLTHDYGNTITQELLARDEEGRLDFQIVSICMLNGALFPETHRPVLAQKLLISPIGFLFGKLISDGRFKASLAKIFGAKTQPTAAELDDFVEVFRFNDGHKIAYKLIRYMRERAVYRERWVGALERTKVQFRFINGLADPVSGAHLVKRFREVMPHSDIVELVEIGHFPHLEAPDETLFRIFEFHDRIG
jgi:pimeloyl-ACP methyl ester carboxylesterase